MKPQTRRIFLGRAGRMALAGLGFAPMWSLILNGCKTMETVTEIGTAVGVGANLIDGSQADSIQKSVRAVSRTFADFTPEQEYYVGRTVGAVILDQYPPYPQPGANEYLNLLGQTLARASDLPETFGGYHFLIQDTDEINALAAPGGLVFITRGLLRCCPHEDAVAAVLAHEIGHVQARHGLQAIKKSRVTEALTTLGLESAKQFAGRDVANLTRIFEASIADITASMINRGYSRQFEKQADEAAVTILNRVGYSPFGLIDMLEVMQQRLTPDGHDFAQTHPSPAERARHIQQRIGPRQLVQRPAARQKRFETALGNI